jgi:CheY-like chemotaxis protein
LKSLTHSQSGEVVVDVGDLAASNKQSAIHVLHVDDDPSIIEVSKQILKDIDARFEINDACCVDETFQKLDKQPYDAIVSDYEMPKKLDWAS